MESGRRSVYGGSFFMDGLYAGGRTVMMPFLKQLKSESRTLPFLKEKTLPFLPNPLLRWKEAI